MSENERSTEFDPKSVALVHEAARERSLATLSNPPDFAAMIERRNNIIAAADQIFVEGIHYGTPPGCKAPMLYQEGSADLGSFFQVYPKITTTMTILENGHREYEATCKLCKSGGVEVVEGSAVCSTMESKFRYTWNNGKKEERKDLADVYHNARAAAAKRAYTRAIRTATGDILKMVLHLRKLRESETQQQQPAPPRNVTPAKKKSEPEPPPKPYDPQDVLEKLIGESHGKIEGLAGRDMSKKEVAGKMTAFLEGNYSEKAARAAEKEPAKFVAALAEFIRTGKRKEKNGGSATTSPPIDERAPEDPPFGKPDEPMPEDLLPEQDPQDKLFGEL